jgi:hypothetical protein
MPKLPTMRVIGSQFISTSVLGLAGAFVLVVVVVVLIMVAPSQ